MPVHKFAEAVAPRISYEWEMLKWTAEELRKFAIRQRKGDLECYLAEFDSDFDPYADQCLDEDDSTNETSELGIERISDQYFDENDSTNESPPIRVGERDFGFQKPQPRLPGIDTIINIPAGSGCDQFPQINAFLESFLMHARNLIEFFSPLRKKDKNSAPSKKYEDDVHASDFFDTPASWSTREITPILRDARERIHKSLAHISYKRIEYEQQKLWDIAPIFNDIKTLWTEFQNDLPEERREWFHLN